MANRRPLHRKGTTTRAYRKAQQQIFKRTVCERCWNAKGPIVREKCDPAVHPTHATYRYCPTHPLAPSLGHKTDLQDGGSVLDPSNHRLEHYGCNSSAGVKARMAKAKGKRNNAARQSWEW